MREFTAIIARERNHFVAICPDLAVAPVHGRTLSEARDFLVSAIQRHVDLACEQDSSPSAEKTPKLASHDLATYFRRARNGEGELLRIPETLLTRN